MKKLLVASLIILFSLPATAVLADQETDSPSEGAPDEADEETIAFGFDFLPLLGTSSSHPDARRKVSYNLVGGLSGGIDTFEFGGVFNLATGDVRGVQLAGATNAVLGDVSAAQLAGSMNVVSGTSRGAQLAGGLNLTGEDSRGAQLAGGLNLTDGDSAGAQISGGSNLALGDVDGAQISGGLNLATGQVNGAQISPFNIATGHVDGTQIGVVNVAPSADSGVGVLGIYWDGFLQAEAFGSADGLTMAGIRHGSGSFYNSYFVGTRPFDAGETPLAYGLAVGWRTGMTEGTEFSLDVSGTSLITDDNGWSHENNLSLLKLRPMLSAEITDGIALFGGPTATVMLSNDSQVEANDLAPIDSWQPTDDDAEVDVAIWPGFTAGVRLF